VRGGKPKSKRDKRIAQCLEALNRGKKIFDVLIYKKNQAKKKDFCAKVCVCQKFVVPLQRKG
jgi:hypothetical protein